MRKHCNIGRIIARVGSWFHKFVVASLVVAKAFQHRWRNFVCKRCGKSHTGKASGLAWIHGTWCVNVHHSNVPGNMGHTASFASSLSGRSWWLSRRQCRSSLFVSAEMLKACALIGLHLMAAEGESGSSGSQSPVLGDMWSKVAQKAQIGTATDTFSPDKFSPITSKVRFSTLCSQKSDEERPSLSDHDSSLLLEDWELPRCPG